MKSVAYQFLTILSLLLSPLVFSDEIQIRPVGGGGMVLRTSLDFAKHLNSPASWKFRNAGELSLKMDGEETRFLLNGETEIFRLKGPEYVDEAFRSENGERLILKVMFSRGHGSDYSALLHIHVEKGKLVVERILEGKVDLFDGGRWWISDGGAISNDGILILCEFGVSAKNQNRMGYEWYTVDLSSQKVVGKGLRIENGQVSKPK